jgi:hypothetical protein
MAAHREVTMCPMAPSSIPLSRKRGHRRRRAGANCWRLVGDGRTRKKLSA